MFFTIIVFCIQQLLSNNEFTFLSICYCPQSDPKAWRLSRTPITDFIPDENIKIILSVWLKVRSEATNLKQLECTRGRWNWDYLIMEGVMVGV